MREEYRDDLSDFVRHGKLDAYELTDEELAHLLEIWRWSVWTKRSTPSGPDHDVNDAAHRLQRQLARADVEVEYNTALLLKQELEALMHLRVLLDLGKALRYFLRPIGLWRLLRAWRQVRRYHRVQPVRRSDGTPLGYPRYEVERCRPIAPDLLKRPYWRQLHPYSFRERKQRDFWW